MQKTLKFNIPWPNDLVLHEQTPSKDLIIKLAGYIQCPDDPHWLRATINIPAVNLEQWKLFAKAFDK